MKKYVLDVSDVVVWCAPSQKFEMAVVARIFPYMRRLTVVGGELDGTDIETRAGPVAVVHAASAEPGAAEPGREPCPTPAAGGANFREFNKVYHPIDPFPARVEIASHVWASGC